MSDEVQSTSEQPVSRAKDEVIREAQRIEEDALYSSKGHFVAAQAWSAFHLIIGVPTAVLAAIAAASALDDRAGLAAVIAGTVAALTALTTFVNPKEQAGAHLNSGNDYDALMNRVRIFWSIDCWQSDSDLVLTEALKAISVEKSRLNRASLQIPWWAYRLARKGISSGEATHEVDKAGTDYQ